MNLLREPALLGPHRLFIFLDIRAFYPLSRVCHSTERKAGCPAADPFSVSESVEYAPLQVSRTYARGEGLLFGFHSAQCIRNELYGRLLVQVAP